MALTGAQIKKLEKNKAEAKEKAGKNEERANEKMDNLFHASKNEIAPKKKKPSKADCKSFSLWVDKETLASWRAYADTKEINKQDLVIYAIKNYMENVAPLTKEEVEAYNEKYTFELANIDKDARKK